MLEQSSSNFAILTVSQLNRNPSHIPRQEAKRGIACRAEFRPLIGAPNPMTFNPFYSKHSNQTFFLSLATERWFTWN